MAWSEETITSGGVTLHAVRAQADEPKGALALVHGYGEHVGRYGELAALFNRLGLSVYMYDQRGHGRSGGPRGAVRRWSEYLDDLDAFLAQAAQWHGGPVETVFGHSMGGLVAACHALLRPHQLKVLVLSSPLFGLAVKVGGLKLALVKLLSRVAPRLSLPSEIDPAMLSHDPAVGQAYLDDPLVHKVTNVRWVTEMAQAQAQCLARAPRLSVPSLLLVYGTGDPLVSPAACQRFHDATQVGDSQCIAYEGLRHEIFNEADRAKPLADLEQWLGQRVRGQ